MIEKRELVVPTRLSTAAAAMRLKRAFLPSGRTSLLASSWTMKKTSVGAMAAVEGMG